MSALGDFFTTFFYNPIINLLAIIIHFLQLVHIPGALGLSIIILTVLIRILVWPFMSTQLKASKKMAELKPHLDDLKKKHSGDKQALALAQSALYKQHGVNPAAGCLPTLIQLPVLLALYRAIFAFFAPNGLSSINSVLYSSAWHLSKNPDPYFLGLNLASKPSDFSHLGIIVLLIPIVTALLQYIQSSMMTSSSIVKPYPSDSPKEKKEKGQAEDTAAAIQTQMKYMMPLMLGYFAFIFPIGLAIYWNTMTIIGIIQQYFISGSAGVPRVGNVLGKVETKSFGGTKVKIERPK